MPSFGLDELNQIVDLAGRELEREDRYIAGCFARNSAYPEGDPEWIPGILYLNFEGYYQRVAARALLSSFQFRVKLEAEGRFDLALYDCNQLIALGEMKRVMEAGIKGDAALLPRDIAKLARMSSHGPHGQFLLIFTVNPENRTDPWLEELLEGLRPSPAQKVKPYVFPTEFYSARYPELHWEFGVVGLLLKAKEAVA